MNASEIKTRVQNLPALPVVTAGSMIYAQGYSPDADAREAIAARAAFFREMGMPTTVRVDVIDFDGVKIGTLDFQR